MMFRTALLALLVLCALLRVAEAGTRPNVVFLSPDDSRFWHMVADFMGEVASDLNLELEVQFDQDRHRFSYLQMAEQVLSRDDRPDYLVIMCKEHVTTQILMHANELDVKVFTFNTDVPEATRAAVGMPRETLPNWIGHMAPDNVEGGANLIAILEQHAQSLTLTEPSQPLPVVALTGTRDSSAGTDRDRGLKAATDAENSELLQLVHADWSQQQAKDKMLVLLRRYPQAVAIWSASDGMALGAIEAVKRTGRQPGKDLVIGGFDWEPHALEAIREGELVVSLGRHFMGGGLALLLLHDYHQGVDFADGPSSAALSYRFEPATRDNVDTVERILTPASWQAVNFQQFSRALNAGLQDKPFSADHLMDQFSEALAQHRESGEVAGHR
ncbi:MULTISPECIES: ABC transporter substrate-binding protein [Marinobacter]|jgi:ABC-type sugar transport system substrate-binding protein|uniref:Periplasmic sugar-binding domain protein n=1 Tax=Marinobacter excellens LAMA 842 TaxID=1306954 RepID=A0A137SC69_9GAMM|nr:MULTISPECIES: ABC transporter substrate-binding protein [Marinobacter]KXO10041.1 Periplasmic sugar-binding domain protein [Marinobacter excellens LAMA 842]MCD1631801.1 ABC transporter substrate-binding protein [Marinobacter shengliensis]